MERGLLQFVLQQQRDQQLKAAAAAAAAGRPTKDLQQLKRETAEQQDKQLEKLRSCLSYCRLIGCRRKYLLQQFGEAYTPAAAAAAAAAAAGAAAGAAAAAAATGAAGGGPGRCCDSAAAAAAATGAAGGGPGRCCDNCSDPAAALRRSVLLNKLEASVAAAPSTRRGPWDDAADMPLAPLEIERQGEPDEGWRGPRGGPRGAPRGPRWGGDGGRQGGGRVVYKNPTAATARQTIPDSIRKKGLSAVMLELEKRERQQENRSSSKKTPQDAGPLPPSRAAAESRKPLKTLGLCRPLGLQRRENPSRRWASAALSGCSEKTPQDAGPLPPSRAAAAAAAAAATATATAARNTMRCSLNSEPPRQQQQQQQQHQQRQQ
ncbi:uncharacterized protein EMH_0082430 [Eimeria mitis]|uniref:ATP-dependent DNA helicase RecQ zinc-binding domain-containing protein n=1 Tax=Eimeria mitis TaxID=44415 RepID=U6KB39_9EIME|nr:uncharacterized protein EMH_0082430 [Eimeria mitis]CDJ33422.1 hypothetical protein EMH_0082430 [Eimeria mitis]